MLSMAAGNNLGRNHPFSVSPLTENHPSLRFKKMFTSTWLPDAYE